MLRSWGEIYVSYDWQWWMSDRIYMEPHIHFSVNIPSIIQIAETYRRGHEPDGGQT